MKAQICPMCEGRKWVYPEELGTGTDLTTLECQVCHGKGIVFVPETPEEFTMIMNYVPSVTVYTQTEETLDFNNTSSYTVTNAKTPYTLTAK